MTKTGYDEELRSVWLFLLRYIFKNWWCTSLLSSLSWPGQVVKEPQLNFSHRLLRGEVSQVEDKSSQLVGAKRHSHF